MATNEAQLKASRTEINQRLFSSHRIELSNTKTGTCIVALVISSPHIEVLLGDGHIRDSGQMMVFVVEDNLRMTAHKMDLEPLPYALHEMKVREVAKGIVAGVVRGILNSTIERVYSELWTSLASLLRSYTAVHGLHAKREAAVELSEDKITVIHNEKWLRLIRSNSSVTWTRENGSMGTLELTEAGTLRGDNGDEAMDLAAEQWARDLMLNPS